MKNNQQGTGSEKYLGITPSSTSKIEKIKLLGLNDGLSTFGKPN